LRHAHGAECTRRTERQLVAIVCGWIETRQASGTCFCSHRESRAGSRDIGVAGLGEFAGTSSGAAVQVSKHVLMIRRPEARCEIVGELPFLAVRLERVCPELNPGLDEGGCDLHPSGAFEKRSSAGAACRPLPAQKKVA
jgi:hypothetical protein